MVRTSPCPETIRDAGEDRDLIEACLRGDSDALDRFYRDHVAAVRRMVRLQVADAATVEDLVHDTFVRALELLTRFRNEARLDVWLRGIALNLARTDRDRRRRRRRLLAATAEPDDAAPDLEGQTDGRRALHSLRTLLSRLPDEERIAFVLRRLEQLSLQEVADVTGAGVSTVSDRARRATDKLRAWLAEEERR